MPPDRALIVTSTAFSEGGHIPQIHTGRGDDLSPSLLLDPIDPGAKSIAVIMDDLDVPIIGALNHWCIWNLPVSSLLEEAIPAGAILENGAVQGIGYGKHQYRGPKPPFGSHRYIFYVYTLDRLLNLNPDSKKRLLLHAMDGHILRQGRLMGRYP